MQDKLRVIGILYIIFGCLGILGFPLIWTMQKTLAYMATSMAATSGEAEYLMSIVQEMMTLLVPAMIALTVVHIAVNVAVGYCFIKRKLYYTCVVASVLTCLAFPIGTLLGVFSLVALSEEPNRQAFGLKKSK